jgi:hypothetical protein
VLGSPPAALPLVSLAALALVVLDAAITAGELPAVPLIAILLVAILLPGPACPRSPGSRWSGREPPSGFVCLSFAIMNLLWCRAVIRHPRRLR